jgi:hypothetical protein
MAAGLSVVSFVAWPEAVGGEVHLGAVAGDLIGWHVGS